MNEPINVKEVKKIKVHKPIATEQVGKISSRDHIYVRKVKGYFDNLRKMFGLFFLGLFAVLPWIQFNGSQAVLLDISQQRFSIFALTLWPQDLTLLAYIFIVSAFALFFVTTFAGRVWCGFMCPQTAWTYLFIWLEEKIEGSSNKRKKLDMRPMDVDKFIRKFLKHASWLAVSLLTGLTFVGYFTPISTLFVSFFTFSASFWASFFVLFFAFCTYGNAGWMREIMCTHMCPYARFQSAMFDKDTYTVSYNATRGERRAPRPRKLAHSELAEKGLGDCIDCNLCVQVCPTGIDIRNGLQYECINCGACVDACNEVMEKMGYPINLISFTSEHELAGGKTKILRPKLIGYFVVLCIMFGALIADIALRIPLELDIIRDRNTLYRETNDGLVENVYTLKVMNKSQQDARYAIAVQGLPDYRFSGPQQVSVKAGEVLTVPVSVATDPYNLDQRVTEIFITVDQIDITEGVAVEEPTRFIYR